MVNLPHDWRCRLAHVHFICYGLPQYQIVLFTKTTRRLKCHACVDKQFQDKSVGEEIERQRLMSRPTMSPLSRSNAHVQEVCPWHNTQDHMALIMANMEKAIDQLAEQLHNNEELKNSMELMTKPTTARDNMCNKLLHQCHNHERRWQQLPNTRHQLHNVWFSW